MEHFQSRKRLHLNPMQFGATDMNRFHNGDPAHGLVIISANLEWRRTAGGALTISFYSV